MEQRPAGPVYREEQKMIVIRMNTKRLKLTVEGHATPEEGPQYREICAAASALAQALVYSCGKMKDKRALERIEYRPDPGHMMLNVEPVRMAKVLIWQRFKHYADGMELLAKSHPNSVMMISILNGGK